MRQASSICSQVIKLGKRLELWEVGIFLCTALRTLENEKLKPAHLRGIQTQKASEQSFEAAMVLWERVHCMKSWCPANFLAHMQHHVFSHYNCIPCVGLGKTPKQQD